jgi:hypothetical protein
MKGVALSVRQPWASLIVWGLKNVEIRTWNAKYRGPLFIHASRTVDNLALQRFALDNLPTGALIGTVNLTAVESFTETTWDELAEVHLDHGSFPANCYAWHLSNPIPFDEPIPYSGERGLFQVTIDDELIDGIAQSLNTETSK